jgi:hypothetical protein
MEQFPEKKKINFNNEIYNFCGYLENIYYKKNYLLYIFDIIVEKNNDQIHILELPHILSCHNSYSNYFSFNLLSEETIQKAKDSSIDIVDKLYKYIAIEIKTNEIFPFGPHLKISNGDTIHITEGINYIGPLLALIE